MLFILPRRLDENLHRCPEIVFRPFSFLFRFLLPRDSWLQQGQGHLLPAPRAGLVISVLFLNLWSMACHKLSHRILDRALVWLTQFSSSHYLFFSISSAYTSLCFPQTYFEGSAFRSCVATVWLCPRLLFGESFAVNLVCERRVGWYYCLMLKERVWWRDTLRLALRGHRSGPVSVHGLVQPPAWSEEMQVPHISKWLIVHISLVFTGRSQGDAFMCVFIRSAWRL